MTAATRVHAVVVSYRSDPVRLALQFDRLLEQVSTIVWVDNASGDELRALASRWPAERLHTIWLSENRGIGAAQNCGIERALALGATHVLLMDDDSLPSPKMVPCLLDALAAHPRAAAAGSCHVDPRRETERTPFSVVSRGRLRWLSCSDTQQIWEVDHVIASGCLIPAPALQAVGCMREDFFIDWVDIEWCLRARHLGWRIYGVCAALLEHTLGDKVVRVLGREVPWHAPWRHYYQARNFVLMLRTGQLAGLARCQMVLRQLKRFIIFSTLVPGRWNYCRMWMLGLLHGCQGRAGPLVRPGSR
ncbi:MAG: glycosyltransferase family 2 protein [Proteobacteria bacterium]|nr:glycosyltransferase family 2 protein [Pseudomonadota bacterium]